MKTLERPPVQVNEKTSEMDWLKKQSATGFLASIVLGLLLGGSCYFVLTAPSERHLKFEQDMLQQQRDWDRQVDRGISDALAGRRPRFR